MDSNNGRFKNFLKSIQTFFKNLFEKRKLLTSGSKELNSDIIDKKIAKLNKQLKKSGKRLDKYSAKGLDDKVKQEIDRYNKIASQILELEELKRKLDNANIEPQQNNSQDSNTYTYDNKENDLQKELEASAKKMKEYRDAGNYEQEAQEHEHYNKILNEINKQEELNQENTKEEKDNKEKDLQKELEASARRMKEYRDAGNYEQEAQEHENYNKILNEMNGQNKKEEKQDNQHNMPQWNSKLTQEQIDELKAEGIQPGDNEYDQALWNYGINPNEQTKKQENEIRWNSKLTQEQIEEALSKGIDEPAGPEYLQFLGELGIKPTYLEEIRVNKDQLKATPKKGIEEDQKQATKSKTTGKGERE